MLAVKTRAVQVVLRMSGAYLSNRYASIGKLSFWQYICVPYLCWRDTELRCTTGDGHHFYVRPSDFVENRICFFRTWEPAITRVFKCLVKSGDIVVDVGANIGYYSVLAASLVGEQGHVYSVEASRSVRSRLARNIELNKMTNVTILPYAAWDAEGDSVLHLLSGNWGGSTLSSKVPVGQHETVELRRLDRLIPTDTFNRIRLIKLDIEGAEVKALRGMSTVLENNPDCAVICEITPERLKDFDTSAADIFDVLAKYKLRAYSVVNDYTAEHYISPLQGAVLRSVDSCSTTPTDVLFVNEQIERILVSTGLLDVA